jgi:hypothetical protein
MLIEIKLFRGISDVVPSSSASTWGTEINLGERLDRLDFARGRQPLAYLNSFWWLDLDTGIQGIRVSRASIAVDKIKRLFSAHLADQSQNERDSDQLEQTRIDTFIKFRGRQRAPL